MICYLVKRCQVLWTLTGFKVIIDLSAIMESDNVNFKFKQFYQFHLPSYNLFS
jgi:hypothetical protein